MNTTALKARLGAEQFKALSMIDENGTASDLGTGARRRLGLTRGYCGVTANGGSCAKDKQGARGLNSLMSRVESPHTWQKALRACQRFCSTCANCNFITLSLSADDCSWREHETRTRYPRCTRHMHTHKHTPHVMRCHC